MARLRLNQEYRNKIANRMRVHLEQEETQEKENFFQLREKMIIYKTSLKMLTLLLKIVAFILDIKVRSKIEIMMIDQL
jgi:hypothetical protein